MIRPTYATIRLIICAAALVLSNRFCLADTCPPDHQAPMPPSEELLAHAYQPPDGDILHRYRFQPPAPYDPPYPTVLMLPPDVFNLPYGDHGVASERWATYDLQQAGFLVFQVDHRLAPGHGKLPGQTSSGRPPDQTDDVKRQILAALAEPTCNGHIYLVGGSGGGSLALWVMLDPTAGLVPLWDDSKRTTIKAVASLSGISDLCDWRNPGNVDLTGFIHGVDNYVGLADNVQDCSKLSPPSPVTLVPNATSSPPVILYATLGDPVPYQQALDMKQALNLKFGFTLEVDQYTMSYTDDETKHAFLYWHQQNDAITPQVCVSSQVIAFLQSYP